MNDWTKTSATGRGQWEELLKKELKTDDLGRVLKKALAEGGDLPVLSTEAKTWFDPSFKRAALSYTWTREEDVSWSKLPDFVAQGIWDFILDPFLLGWDEVRLKHELTLAAAHIKASNARLWVCHETALLPEGAFRVLSATDIVARGGHAVHELGYLLATLIEWAQTKPQESIGVALTLDCEFFKSIAKKRAFKATLEAAFNEMGCSELLNRVTCIGRAPWRNFTAYDCTNNILRNATSVAAGYIAGLGVVESLPYDLLVTKKAGEQQQAERVALTTQLVLQSESYLSDVADPASGGYAIEHLTRTLGEEAWAQMQRLMALVPEEREPHLGESIDHYWGEVQKKFRTRKSVQTGVNDFPEVSDAVVLRSRWLKDDHVRLARQFEELRLAVPAKKPTVAIAVVGDYAALQARFNFTKNYFELLGLTVVENGQGMSVSEAGVWLGKEQAAITAWVSKDEDHAVLKAIGSRCYVAGKTPVTGCLNLYAGQDVLATLEDLVLWWKGQ